MDVMGAEPKISLLKKNNMAFVEEDGKCNFEAVKNLKWVLLTIVLLN